jgi:hypothetical protein
LFLAGLCGKTIMVKYLGKRGADTYVPDRENYDSARPVPQFPDSLKFFGFMTPVTAQ